MSKHKHKQKITLSALLAVVLAALMSLVVLAADETHCAEADCDGQYVNGFCTADDTHYQAATLNDNGTTDVTTDDYYEIGNAGQLYWFAAKVNSGNYGINGKLTANIIVNPGSFSADDNNNDDGDNNNDDDDNNNNNHAISYKPQNEEKLRNWQPIGEVKLLENGSTTFDNAYTGTFDGNSKTISGLYCTDNSKDFIALFGHINNATIKDLGITNSAFDAREAAYCGSFVALADASDSGTCMITNCYTTDDVIVRALSNKTLYCGGLGGFLRSHGTLTITGCRASGSIYIYDSDTNGVQNLVGGLFGNASTNYSSTLSSRIDISDCHNKATVNLQLKHAATVGGLIGGCSFGSIINISGCHNEGDLNLNTGRNANAGGLIGSIGLGNNKVGEFTLKSCYNTGNGNVISNQTSCYGGLVGNIDNTQLSMKNCYNTGAGYLDTFNDRGEEVASYCGGVIGKLTGTGTRTFSGLYYLLPETGTATAASGDGSAVNDATKKRAEEFASGEVCYLLNNGSTSTGTEENPLIWKQVVSATPSDESPKLEGFTVKYDEANNKYYNDIPILPLVKGAQIRNDDNYGLRFGFVYNGSENAIAGYENISYGALLVPQAIIGTKEITLETAKKVTDSDGNSMIANVEHERDFEDSNENAIIYTAVLYDIPYVSETDNKYAVDIVAVPYVKFTVGGIEYTAYGEQIVRSVNQVKGIIDSWTNNNNDNV